MCDVVFITPNMSGEPAEEVIGTLQLATILNQNQIDCEILQFFLFGDVSDFDSFQAKAIQLLDEKKPKIISFYTRCDSYHIDIRLAQLIKARRKDVYVVFGGPQSDIAAAETIAQIPQVDYICCGEGETTVYPFFSSLLRGKPDLTVPGLCYRDGEGVVKNPRPQLIQDLDSLPFIDYDSFRFLRQMDKSDRGHFPIDVGRGCPFGCTYCSTKTFWGRKFRLKSPARIVQEVKKVHEKFGLVRFSLSHDMFTLHRDKVIETCSLLNTLDFPIEWKCSARLDCIDPELIDIMAASGMRRIFIGIETGSKRMQKLINKNLKLDNAVEMIAYLKSKGISTTASFIFGFPEETEEDLSQTLFLIAELLKLGSVEVRAHLCTFLAGTELSEKYISQMTRTEQYSDVTGNYAIAECNDIIEEHPELFLHMLEYKSDMRTRLKFFKQFLRVWGYMQPVYGYLAEQYPANRLIDMYYDFVDANREFLQEMGDLPSQQFLPLFIRHDRLPERFSNIDHRDIIKDLYRLKIAETSQQVKNGGILTEIYCFDPAQRQRCASIQEYKRCVAVTTISKDRTNSLIYPYVPNA